MDTYAGAREIVCRKRRDNYPSHRKYPFEHEYSGAANSVCRRASAPPTPPTRA